MRNRMAAGIQGAGFWLPSEFLTDDDFLMDEENSDNAGNNELHSHFCFPSEFPYHSETRPHHLLQKSCMMSTSPQSTLPNFRGSNNGSPNGAQSPLTMPIPARYDDVGDLICLAAGEVAKFKLNQAYAVNTSCALPLPRNLTQFSHTAKIPTPSVYLNTKFENVGARAVRGVDQVAFPPHRISTTGRAALIGGGAAVKKVCAGTGVFLPRRYENQNMSHSNAYSPATRRKPGCSASPFQGRASGTQIHTTKPCNDPTFGFVESQPQLHSRINRAFISDLNSILAPRHAVVLQQRRSFLTPLPEGPSKTGRDHPCLPQEWTY